MIDYKTIIESKKFIVLDKYNKEWAVAEGYQSEGELERELIRLASQQGIQLQKIRSEGNRSTWKIR